MSVDNFFPYKVFMMGSSILIGSLLYFYKLKKQRKSSSHRRKLIEHLTKKQISITKRLEKLYEEEIQEKTEDKLLKKQSIDYSIPLNDPSLKAFSTLSIREKMKNKLNLLGDYLNLQEHEFNGDYSFYFKDFHELKTKLLSMKKDGIDKLQIVSDFDQTTTCFEINNKQSCSSFGTFRLSELTSQTFKKTTQSLYNSYAPIEFDPNINIRHKKLLLKDWYEAVKEAFLHENITKQKCLSILNDANIGLRYGYLEFFNICKVMNLPYYMISGGLTQMVQTILAKANDISNYSNFFTFSNDMVFDDHGNLIDLLMKVYPTTKSGILDKRKFSFKPNTLLFGDLITDIEMSSEMACKNLISIGFLEGKKKDLLKDYLEKFDIVIEGEGDFLLHDKILRYIAGIEENPFFKEKIENNEKFGELEKLWI